MISPVATLGKAKIRAELTCPTPRIGDDRLVVGTPAWGN